MHATERSTTPARFKRRRKLIQPRLQLKLTAISTFVALIALLMQYLLFARSLTSLAAELPEDSLRLLQLGQPELMRTLLTTLVLLLPLSIAVGVLSTFRVAGPVYRLEQYMRSVLAGERPEDCRLRKGDELNELCDLVNEVTRAQREGLDGGSHSSASEELRRSA
ncbi:MAG: hypothetical protein ACYSWX_01895 [Planctomycetota bacterium]|jgi:hypothetical protein